MRFTVKPRFLIQIVMNFEMCIRDSGNSLSQISADKEFPLLASLKQLDERRYKITVSNGYRPDGRKVCKARTLHVPKKIPRRSVLQYVMHAAEELEKEFKYGYAEDGEKTFEAYV